MTHLFFNLWALNAQSFKAPIDVRHCIASQYGAFPIVSENPAQFSQLSPVMYSFFTRINSIWL